MSVPVTGKPGTFDTYTSFILVEFERRVTTGPGTYSSTFFRYCNGPQAIIYTGAAGFDRPTVSTSFISRYFPNPTIMLNGDFEAVTQLNFEDFDDVFKTLALGYDFLDWRVKIWEVGVDTLFNTTWIKLKIAGRTEGMDWDVSEGKNVATVPIKVDSTAGLEGPREEYMVSCRFHFKSARCGYVGIETVCNRTLTRCTALANNNRFGGFPRAPNPGDRLSNYSGLLIIYPARNDLFPISSPTA